MKVTNVQNQLHPASALIPLNPDLVEWIVVHHTDSSDTTTWQDINDWHKQNTWSCAGYNSCVYPNGDVYILRGLHIGAQVESWNSKTFGVALIGNFDKTTIMPLAQFSSLIDHIRQIRTLFPNLKGIKGHKELGQTSCPGQYCNLDLIKECGMKDE